MGEIRDYNFTLFGNNPTEALRALWYKKRNSYENGNKRLKLGLIIEGGGMKSITAGGMLVALHKFGFHDVFDYLYGSSAGSLGGAYFLSEQAPYGIGLYYEDLNNTKFINTYIFPPRFNIDYLIDSVKYNKSLDVETVKRHPSELFITATDAETGECCFFSSHDESVDLLTAIKASCALPIYYGRAVEINGRKYLDGALVGPLPILKAIRDGCTHLFILLNKSQNHRDYHKPPRWIEQWYLKRYYNFHQEYYQRHKTYQYALRLMEGLEKETANIPIAVIAPTDDQLKLTTTQSSLLKKAYYESYTYMTMLLQRYSYDDRAEYIS
jgi:predicted patatin/cPLA2 family phospholipase